MFEIKPEIDLAVGLDNNAQGRRNRPARPALGPGFLSLANSPIIFSQSMQKDVVILRKFNYFFPLKPFPKKTRLELSQVLYKKGFKGGGCGILFQIGLT